MAALWLIPLPLMPAPRKYARYSLTAWVQFKDRGTNVASIEGGRNFASDANGSRNQSLLIFEVLTGFVDWAT